MYFHGEALPSPPPFPASFHGFIRKVSRIISPARHNMVVLLPLGPSISVFDCDRFASPSEVLQAHPHTPHHTTNTYSVVLTVYMYVFIYLVSIYVYPAFLGSLLLFWKGKERFAELLKSPRLRQKTVPFSVVGVGIRDAQGSSSSSSSSSRASSSAAAGGAGGSGKRSPSEGRDREHSAKRHEGPHPRSS